MNKLGFAQFNVVAIWIVTDFLLSSRIHACIWSVVLVIWFVCGIFFWFKVFAGYWFVIFLWSGNVFGIFVIAYWYFIVYDFTLLILIDFVFKNLLWQKILIFKNTKIYLLKIMFSWVEKIYCFQNYQKFTYKKCTPELRKFTYFQNYPTSDTIVVVIKWYDK
jgi:hypothetical protein